MPQVPILYLTLLVLVHTTMSQDIPGSRADGWLPRNGLVKKATSSSFFFSKDRFLALDIRQEEECPPGYSTSCLHHVYNRKVSDGTIHSLVPCGGFEYCCPESDSNCVCPRHVCFLQCSRQLYRSAEMVTAVHHLIMYV